MLNIKQNILLKDYTTLEIGGPANYFVAVRTQHEVKKAIQFAEEKNLDFYILADGSDLLISDSGYGGLVIKIDLAYSEYGKNEASVASGVSLQSFVDNTISYGLQGAEKLTGIPGTVGGAIYGNAGAFGQTISDHLVEIKVSNGHNVSTMSKESCKFGYRESILKDNKNLVILEASFEFEKGDTKALQKTAKEVLETRAKKYTPGIKCPGSFFKNLLIDRLPKELQKDMPKDYYGKVPAWWFLERVGAKGASRRKIKIAEHHANLFTNQGGGTAADFFAIAREYKDKVKEKFSIELEPEVQLVGFKNKL